MTHAIKKGKDTVTGLVVSEGKVSFTSSDQPLIVYSHWGDWEWFWRLWRWFRRFRRVWRIWRFRRFRRFRRICVRG